MVKANFYHEFVFLGKNWPIDKESPQIKFVYIFIYKCNSETKNLKKSNNKSRFTKKKNSYGNKIYRKEKIRSKTFDPEIIIISLRMRLCEPSFWGYLSCLFHCSELELSNSSMGSLSFFCRAPPMLQKGKVLGLLIRRLCSLLLHLSSPIYAARGWLRPSLNP